MWFEHHPDMQCTDVWHGRQFIMTVHWDQLDSWGIRVYFNRISGVELTCKK